MALSTGIGVPAGSYGMTQATWLKYLTVQFRKKLRVVQKSGDKAEIKKFKKIVKQCERDEARWANRHQASIFDLKRSNDEA